MPFSKLFNTVDRCFEHQCRIDNRNIKKIFKPDSGFLDKIIESKIFYSQNYKICDCIIVCKNDNINVVEILCGILTLRKLNDKITQLENCYKVVEHERKIVHKTVLLYDRLVSSNQQPMLKKKLLSSKIFSLPLVSSPKSLFNIDC